MTEVTCVAQQGEKEKGGRRESSTIIYKKKHIMPTYMKVWISTVLSLHWLLTSMHPLPCETVMPLNIDQFGHGCLLSSHFLH